MPRILTYVEIDVPFCANSYGLAPCAAAIGVTGNIKCFNTPATCQDRVNYVDDPVTLRFAKDQGFLPRDIDCISSIKDISFTPAVVSLGKDLGTRASLSVTFKDHPWPDTGAGFDKYVTERPYVPMAQGTFWGKFRARQPFLRGRAIRVIRGELGQALEDMETRHFFIDSFSHNAADGTFTITAKDLLKFADDDRAQAPALSNGFLVTGIADTDLTASLTPSGIGDEEYPASGYVAIGGKEICAFVRDDTSGNDANTKLLLHMEGADAATAFTDSSSSAKTVTANGNAQIDTAQFKFGLSSALFDGSGDYLSLADHADWTPAGNFTIDFQAKWNALAGTQYLFTHYTDGNNRYFLSVSAAGALTFSVVSASSTIVTMTSANAVVAAGQAFKHIAVVRNGNVWTIYVNGVSVATTTDADAIPNFTNQLRIGVDHNAANGINGWIDEFRFSHVARWTAAFTPPISAYQTSGNVLTLTRGQLGTEAIDHDAQDRVQLVLRYVAEDPADIIRDLLVNYAGVDDAYIPIAAWQNETAAFLNRVLSADIAEPTGVKQLLAEIIEDAALSLWWDEVTPQLRLRVLRAIATDAAVFDEGSYLEGSFGSREQPETRLSQIWRYFAKRDPLAGAEDPDNYRSVAATVDLEAETDYGSSAIHKIFSRWIGFGGRTVADKANQLYLARFRDPPRRFTFSTFREGGNLVDPVLGQGYRIAGMGLQDETGAATTAPIQITKLKPGEAQFDIEAEEMLVTVADEDLTDRVIIIDSDIFNIDLRDLHDSLYPAPTDDDVSSGGVNLTCIVETGVIVGSEAAATPSFIVGDWPVGFPITLIVNGRIQGAGGDGGRQNVGGGHQDGEDGGTALYTRFPIDLEVSTGAVWGGGGGGGAGAYTKDAGGHDYKGSGGGGGAGQLPGDGAAGQSDGDGSGPANNGSPGTLTTGGAGGAQNNTGSPGYFNAGGTAGGPGLAASNDAGARGEANNNKSRHGNPGAAGNAIDGVSFVTVTAGPGDRRGPEIN